MPNYIVTTSCRATIVETWRLYSDRPLTEEDIADAVSLPCDDDGNGVRMEFLTEESADEEERIYLEYEPEIDPNDCCPHCGANLLPCKCPDSLRG